MRVLAGAGGRLGDGPGAWQASCLPETDPPDRIFASVHPKMAIVNKGSRMATENWEATENRMAIES